MELEILNRLKEIADYINREWSKSPLQILYNTFVMIKELIYSIENRLSQPEEDSDGN